MRLPNVVGLVLLWVATSAGAPIPLENASPATAGDAAMSLRLARIFGSGMVLQRDQTVRVWGWSSPRLAVVVTLNGRSARAISDTDGTWRVEFARMKAGGPFDLIATAGDERIALHDVMIGDVWIASGQSNMEFTVSQGNDAANEIARAGDSLLRQFKVPTSWANAPESDLAGGSWAGADPAHAGDFSAVAYFFARELRGSEKIPIGIVNTTWGGSAIETWMSRRAHKFTDSSWAVYLAKDDARRAALQSALRAQIGDLPTSDRGMSNGKPVWNDPALDDREWSSIPVPAYWESNGYDGMDGIGWYRTSFSLSDAEARVGVTLTMTAIDDDDITWVNGVEAGRTSGYNKVRTYAIPPAALHAGTNVLAVRVTDFGGGGGINASVMMSAAGGAPRSLAGQWKFKVGEVSFHEDGQQINKVPTVLYNRMIFPLLQFPIKGVIWYQGESNANNDAQATGLRAQFATLISSWRSEWNMGHAAFPFLWVQLPNYGSALQTPPSAESWATARESMAAALALGHTGQAIAIDVGEAENIHPRNKQDVGRRLGLVALERVYGRHVIASGPTYKSHTVRDNIVRVTFDHVAGGLISRAVDGSVGGFAIAGADHRWVWASARVVGNRVDVWSSEVTKPVAVRYAWANNPDKADLYNGAQLPAEPFRTDRW